MELKKRIHGTFWRFYFGKCYEKLCFENYIFGMRDIDRYITLLMGEIARLTDDENGYGPKGAGYTAHIDIPEDIKNAFFVLKQIYGNKVRKANPLYASK